MLGLDEKSIFKRNPNIVIRVIGGDTILMPIYGNSEEINCIYSLNETAALIWKLIDGKKNLKQIKSLMVKQFDTPEKKMDMKLGEFFKELIENNIVISKDHVKNKTHLKNRAKK